MSGDVWLTAKVDLGMHRIARSAVILTAGLLIGCSTIPTELRSAEHSLYEVGNDETEAYREIATALTHLSLHQLQELAAKGHRAAAFVLGHAYEFGRGVDVDLHQAVSYYSLASKPTSEKRTFYQPPVGDQTVGTSLTVPVASRGIPVAPLAEARVRAALAANALCY